LILIGEFTFVALLLPSNLYLNAHNIQLNAFAELLLSYRHPCERRRLSPIPSSFSNGSPEVLPTWAPQSLIPGIRHRVGYSSSIGLNATYNDDVFSGKCYAPHSYGKSRQ
jgi:hypothetical protein